jgi:arsenate reductase (thioredoxin)
MMWDKPKVLFLCTGHPERSEMAEGFLRSFVGEAMIPVSAAIEPAPLSPLAVDAMKEVGIDISQQQVKDVPAIFNERFAYAIGVGDQSKERCPVFPFAFRLFRWSLEDPAEAQGSPEERLAAFRRVRNAIDHNVREFLAQVSADRKQPVPAR